MDRENLELKFKETMALEEAEEEEEYGWDKDSVYRYVGINRGGEGKSKSQREWDSIYFRHERQCEMKG